MYLTHGVGLLVSGIMGTFPALALLAFGLWCCCVIVERREGTNRTPSSEAVGDGVRPRIHEALIAENSACRDGSHVLTWKETQVSLFTQCVGAQLF